MLEGTIAAMLASIALIVLLPASVQSERDSSPGEHNQSERDSSSSSSSSSSQWSAPTVLGTCSSPGKPAVLFPSDTPRHGTGPGAIVWSAASGCPGGGGPRVAAIAPRGDDIPKPASIARTRAGRALGMAGPVAAAAAPHGRILLAAPAASRSGRAGGLLLSEGVSSGPFAAPWPTGGAAAPLALTTAYLGDLATASPGGFHDGASAIALRVHRYYAGSFFAPVSVDARPSSSIEGLTLALDYRSDALVAWERAGAIHARDMPGSGRSARAVMHVASAAPGADIAALRSDDNRGILAWSETRAGVTRVYAELSAPGVHFGTPRLLERFADPYGLAPPQGSLRLIRLLSESVMLVWTGAQAGHWVVRAAAVDLNGVRSVNTISTPGHDALLRDLAPGPAGEAYALWSEPRPTPTGLDLDDQAVYAARGIDAYPGRTIFTAPEPVSASSPRGSIGEAAIATGPDGSTGEARIATGPDGSTGEARIATGPDGSTGEATIAVDPDTDRAIAVWRTSDGAIDYSLRALGGA